MRTLQQRYRYDPRTGWLTLDPHPLSARQLDDLLCAQDELTGEILARHDRLAAGRLERRTARLGDALGRVC